MFGIRSYVPYQLLVILLHLAAAVLLRVVMRRAGVRPWIATLTAGVFVFFGAGAENILIAFQITFVGVAGVRSRRSCCSPTTTVRSTAATGSRSRRASSG